MHEEDEDQDSLFGSPPPSPQLPTTELASIYDNERRLSTSTDTQNVGTIALPGSHNSELPLNPLALSLNHTTVQWPPAHSQDQPTTVNKNVQPWSRQTPPAQNNRRETSKSQSPFSNVPPRDPEFSFPDPSEPPPAHFLRNQQNLLGIAGLVAGVKPSTITHIRGTSFNPIVVDDEDTPMQQKDILPVLDGILGIIGKNAVRPSPSTGPPTTSFLSRNDSPTPPPIKKRKLHSVPAGATDWDVPYPFQEGDGPDEYHKTWERKRSKDLVVQLVKLIELAARKGAIKGHPQKEKTREASMVGEGRGKEKEVLGTDLVGFSSADATIRAEEESPSIQPTDIILPPSYEQEPENPTPPPPPVPAPTPAPPPKNTPSISQSRKEEILRGAREKRRQIQEELDMVKTQLWETTIEQAALVHLLKRYDSEVENDQDDLDGDGSGISTRIIN
jgi:hypothetical protein